MCHVSAKSNCFWLIPDEFKQSVLRVCPCLVIMLLGRLNLYMRRLCVILFLKGFNHMAWYLSHVKTPVCVCVGQVSMSCRLLHTTLFIQITTQIPMSVQKYAQFNLAVVSKPIYLYV